MSENFPSISTIYRWNHLEYIPKTNIEKLRRKGTFKRLAETRVNNEELNKKLDLLNNRPRKCINYKIPNELINEQIIKYCA